MAEALKIRWTYSLKTPPERLWPAVSYTERVNKAIGMPEAHFIDMPHPGGGTVRDGSATVMGWPQRWREHPYEWVEPSWFQVVRDYEAGPLARMISRMEMAPAEGGGSEVSFVLELTPANIMGWVAAKVETSRLKGAIKRVYERIDEAMQSTDSLADLQIDFAPYELLSLRLDDAQQAQLRERLAAAFAHVREHFTVLRRVAAESSGTVVKTIGDAIMAVWGDPLAAVQAALEFQPALDADPSTAGLVIKVGVHHGRCIGVNLNEVLDYFGTTVNHAARLERVAGGGEVALSDDLANQPTVADWLANHNARQCREVEVTLKGLRGTHRVVVLSTQRGSDELD